MSIHIGAKKGDFAKVVLMPGDPLRAKWIAENFLVDVKKVTEVRGILGYTGYSKKNHKRISVMASGMGQPSMAIYSHELFNQYDVDVIIRVGTCGGYQKTAKLKDIVIASGASTDFNYMYDYHLNGHYSAIADYEILETAVNEARKANKSFCVGSILSEGVFYHKDLDAWKKWAEIGTLACEMESYALYCNAAIAHKKALCMLTITDIIATNEQLTSSERQLGLVDMIEVAIATAEHFA